MAKYDFAMPDKLTDTEIEAILETADQLVAWASDIKEYALQQSLQGKTWKNWKLVEAEPDEHIAVKLQQRRRYKLLDSTHTNIRYWALSQ